MATPLGIFACLVLLATLFLAIMVFLLRRLKDTTSRPIWTAEVDLVIMLGWALWLGRSYLDFDPTVWPSGREFGMALGPNFIWQNLFACGPCVFWNGATNGGAPAFANLYGAMLHPLVVLPTLLFGAINGAKVTLIATLFMAGVGQWWLLKVLGISRWPRLWGVLMVMAAGHLAGKMEYGLINLTLSTAACSLVIAAALDLALTRQRRATILLAITLALAILSGQGYLQVGLLVAIMPAYLLVFLTGHITYRRALFKELSLAGLLAIALAAVFWLPMGHFWPNFAKAVSPDFSGVQPVFRMLLNLVTPDLTGTLELPLPMYLYLNYIGWVPLILAGLAILVVLQTPQRRLILFFALAIGLVFLAASGLTFEMLMRVLGPFAGWVRYPSLIVGLATPLILALAAWSVDRLIHLQRVQLRSIHLPHGQTIQQILLAGVLLAALYTCSEVNHNWLATSPTDPIVFEVPDQLKALNAQAQWIDITSREGYWIPAALNINLKLTDAPQPWYWTKRPQPAPRLGVTRGAIDPNSPQYLGEFAGWILVDHPENEYAFVEVGNEKTACAASARGGDIDVDCNNTTDGWLTVNENSWTGWYASRDGDPIDLESGQWLKVAAPAGPHHYEFRYRPWDVTLGLALSGLGLLTCLILWRATAKRPPTHTANTPVAPIPE